FRCANAGLPAHYATASSEPRGLDGVGRTREDLVVPRRKPRALARGEPQAHVSETIADHRCGHTNAIERDVDEPSKPVLEPRRIDVPSSEIAEGGKRDVAVVAQRRRERLVRFAWRC